MRILTANRLADGRVVYLGAGGWSRDPAAACRARDDREAALLDAEGRRAAAENRVTDPYLIELADGVPARRRERIRALGPTVRANPASRKGEG